MRSSLWILFFLVAACAKPNYVAGPTTGGVNEKAGPGCQAHFATQVCVSLIWEKMPTDSTMGSFVFKTFRANLADGTPVVEDLPGNMAIVLWMSMGHGSSPVKVDRLDVGTFRASNVFFVMRGNWEIHVQVKAGNDVKDEAIIPISY